MDTWEKLFDENLLENGRRLFHDKHVEIKNRTDTVIKAETYGRSPQEVSLMIKNGHLISMRCNCPKARSGRNCEHMAAVLFSLYGDKKTEREKERAILAAQQRAAFEEAEREKIRKKQEEIAQRNAQKAARKAERKKKREEAEQAERLRREEEERKRQEEIRIQQEEQQRKAQEEAERLRKEEEARKAAAKEAARKKQEKIQKAIERKERGEEKPKMKNNEIIEAAKPTGYHYYDVNRIMDILKIPKENREKGYKLAQAGEIKIRSYDTGYRDDKEGLLVDFIGDCSKGRKSFPVRVIFSRKEVIRTECSCEECRRSNYYWDSRKKCAYVAGLLYLAGKTIDENDLGDATDRNGAVVLNLFRQHRSMGIVAREEKNQESIVLVPRVLRSGELLELSFKIGNSKMFVVKDLIEFADAVENQKTLLYGKDTYINHQIDNFTQDSRKWLEFINKAAEEEKMIDERLYGGRWHYDVNNLKCASLKLYGWRLDKLYELLQDSGCEYESRNEGKKQKQILHMRDKNPGITMSIEKSKDQFDKEFHGIQVSCALPHFYRGAETSYYVEGEYLSRIDAQFMDRIKILLEMAHNDELHFQVGRRYLSDFYYNMIPQLEDVVQIEEKNKEEIEEYLPPEVRFIFYLDNIRGNIVCKVHAVYGEDEISILDLFTDREKAKQQSFRMLSREDEILYQIGAFFPNYDTELDVVHCNYDEQLIFQVLEHGVERLAELGEVQYTQAFKNMNVVQKVKVSVGVSLNNGTLDLDIMSDEFEMKELLEILDGYHTRKKYYRLKNGNYVNLDDDNLKMLAELMETMHLPPKEFIRGKLHLPVYRTLYMDKLLEENDTVYSTRDKHFRDLVKNFKTVSESDFEEPHSLSRIMRSYQKNGYKWLRLLECYGFGGILADDMGLGKTLQVIAVLLAAKEAEKPDGHKVSLVVAPASLVFNWKEEFARYAPDLKVGTITGTQEERQQKIAECDENDVIVTSYDLLKRDIAYYEGKEFAYQIIDEAQYIKNHTTAAAKAVKVIKSRTRYALTGTPIENRLSELWSIFDYLMPGFLYGYDVFKRDIETKIVKNEDDGAAKRLQKMVSPFILRRLKTDVLKDLPDKLEEVRYIKIEGEQQKVYDAQVAHMKQTVAEQSNDEFSKNKLQILAELTRLRQICCDPDLCFDNYKGESAKLDACMELVQSALDGGHKILLFSQFTTMLEILEKRLVKEGISYYKITGETPKERRLQLVKDFNEDNTGVFLISLKAGGVGLNLTGADVVIHYDPWWNVAAQNQATDRAHRIGQQKKVIVYKLIVKQSVEEKILKLQESKQNLADKVINGEVNHLGNMSKEELLEILDS